MQTTIHELLKRIKTYNFECETGLLENCVEWKQLNEQLSKMMICPECLCTDFGNIKNGEGEEYFECENCHWSETH